MQLSDRVRDIGTETAFEAAGRARALEAQGRDIIHLEIGEPDFATPPNVREAAKRALDAGLTHYGPPLGLPQLREAIAIDATGRKGFAVDPANVVVTPGAKPVMSFTLLAFGAGVGRALKNGSWVSARGHLEVKANLTMTVLRDRSAGRCAFWHMANPARALRPTPPLGGVARS